ncbi:PREDICTED: F-box protein At1g30790-like [Camelina sativa]|uniref:F-box protein At1g30790-like n=1 Tax=Camelina sativa TaxID=90675 RepID=A0ABM0YIZ2_CAMSA|nr:PREDICTED: F-box protein At1g30790-like [Camelina sativa]
MALSVVLTAVHSLSVTLAWGKSLTYHYTYLGYDPVDDQFKALTKMSIPYQQHDFLEHEVLTLGRGDSSSWRPTLRFERISFIKAPVAVVCWDGESTLIEYKEDVDKHDWSKQTFRLPFSLELGRRMISPGINKVGEFIFAPVSLRCNGQPYYIFYYNVDRNDIRKVMLKGLANDEEFMCRYEIGEQCCVHISPEHVESISSL